MATMKEFLDKALDGIKLDEKEIEKFDNVHIKSKNKTGMVYAIKDNKIVVKTINGLITVDKNDVEKIDEQRVMDTLFKDYKKVQIWKNGKVLFGGPVTGVFGEGFRMKDGSNEVEVHFFK